MLYKKQCPECGQMRTFIGNQCRVCGTDYDNTMTDGFQHLELHAALRAYRSGPEVVIVDSTGLGGREEVRVTKGEWERIGKLFEPGEDSTSETMREP